MPRKSGRPASPSPQPRPEPRDGFIAVGFVRGTHGVRGELKVAPLTEFGERFAPGSKVWIAGAAHAIEAVRAHKNALLLTLDGVATREQANALRSRLLEVPERDLPPLPDGRYYRYQLLGMDVIDQDGASLGHVEDVIETGANDVFVVRDEVGDLLLPAIDEVVKEIDVAARRMVVEVIAGLERRPHTPKRERQSRGSSGASKPS